MGRRSSFSSEPPLGRRSSFSSHSAEGCSSSSALDVVLPLAGTASWLSSKGCCARTFSPGDLDVGLCSATRDWCAVVTGGDVVTPGTWRAAPASEPSLGRRSSAPSVPSSEDYCCCCCCCWCSSSSPITTASASISASSPTVHSSESFSSPAGATRGTRTQFPVKMRGAWRAAPDLRSHDNNDQKAANSMMKEGS